MRKKIIGLVLAVAALLGAGMSVAPGAQAADNCVSSTATGSYPDSQGGHVKITVTFQDTQYDCGTTNNPVDPPVNGARVSQVRLVSDYHINQGYLRVCVDQWGDGTDNFVKGFSFNPTYDGIVSSHYQYTIYQSQFDAQGTMFDYTRRVTGFWLPYGEQHTDKAIEWPGSPNPYGYANQDQGIGFSC